MNEQHPRRTPDTDLAHYGAALWRRKWTIAITTGAAMLVGLGLGLLLSATSEASEGSGTHEAQGTVLITNPQILPDNETLETLDLDGSVARSAFNHEITMNSEPVMERALATLRPDLDPVNDQEAYQAALEQLQENFNAESISGSNLIDLTMLADGEDLASAQMLAIVDAYQTFLDEEVDRQRQDALTTVQERLDRIEGTSAIAASVLSQLTRAARDLRTVDQDISAQSAELVSVEQDIAAAIIATASELGSDGVSTPVTGEQAASFPALTAAAVAIGSSSQELQEFVDHHERNVSAAVVRLQLEDLDHTASDLILASQRTLGLFTDFANESSLQALEAGIEAYEAALNSLRQTLDLLEPITPGTPVIGNRIAQLRPSLLQIESDLQSRLDNTSVLLATANRDRQAMSAEAVAASSTMLAVANAINTLLANEDLDVAVVGRLSAAESRLRTAAQQLQQVESAQLLRNLRVLSDLVLSTGSQIGAVAQSLSTTASRVRAELSAGIVSSNSTETVAQTIRAANTNLQRISESLVTLRQGVTGGELFSELITVDSTVDQATVVLANARTLSDDAATALRQLNVSTRQLGAEEAAILQAISQASAISESTSAEDLNRSIVVQIESGAGSLLDVDERLSEVRSLGLPSTDIVGIVSLSARMNSFANDLRALADLRTSTTDIRAIDNSVQETLALIDTVDSTTLDSDARAVVLESDLRLEASSRLLQQLAQRLRIVVDDSDLQDEVGITLAAERLTGARDRLQAVSELLSEIERPSDVEFGELLTLQEEIESVIADDSSYSISSPLPSVTQVSALGLDKLVEDLSAPLALAGVAGLLIGIIAVFTTEYLDRGVRTLDDIEGVTNLRPIGAVAVGQAKGNPHPPEVIGEPHSLFGESMQLVATEIDRIVENEPGALLMASPTAGDGRTMFALNSAQVLAHRGKRVLLVDANFRKPDLSEILEIGTNRGLADALEFGEDPANLIARRDLFDVLPAGNSGIPPVDLVSRNAFVVFLKDARQKYDAVIVDGPPVLGFPDALVLARSARSVVMMAKSRQSTANELNESHELLERVGANVKGAVLNFADDENFQYLSRNELAYGISRDRRPNPVGRLARRLWPGRSDKAA